MPIELPPAPAAPFAPPMAAEEYHAHPALSHSKIDDWIESPGYFEGRHVTGAIPGPKSDALDFGTLVHLAVLHPEALGERLQLIPAEALSASGSKAGKAWEAYKEANAGRILLKAQEYDPVSRVVDGLLANPDARQLVQGGADTADQWIYEQAILWACDDTGLPLRSLIDCIRKGEWICDVKTTRCRLKKYPLSRDAEEFGWHRQEAMYTEAIAALTGEEQPFFFIVVEKQFPYACAVVELPPAWVERGHRENKRALRQIRAAYDSGRFADDSAGTVLTLAEPAWAAAQSEDYIDG